MLKIDNLLSGIRNLFTGLQNYPDKYPGTNIALIPMIAIYLLDPI